MLIPTDRHGAGRDRAQPADRLCRPRLARLAPPSCRSARSPPTTFCCARRAAAAADADRGRTDRRRRRRASSACPACASRASISLPRRLARSSSSSGCSPISDWFSNNSMSLTISAPRLAVFRGRPALRRRPLSPGRGRHRDPLLWLAYNIVRQPDRPRLDGDPRHGHGRRGDRHSRSAAASCWPTASAPSSAASPARSGPSAYLGTADAHAFDLDKSFEVLFIVIIGGSASLFGNFLGAAFIVLTPIALDLLVAWRSTLTACGQRRRSSNVLRIIFGVIIILLLIKEPDGLASLIGRLARAVGVWPLRA